MKKTNLIEKIFLFAWPYAILFSLILYLITRDKEYLLSFLLGFASSMLMNSLNYRIMKNIYKDKQHLIKKMHIIMYLAKSLFFALILFIAYRYPEEWNIYFTFVGLLTFRVVSLPVTLIFAKKDGDLDD